MGSPLRETEPALIAACRALIGRETALSPAETAVTTGIAPEPDRAILATLRREIGSGGDPLGAAFARIRAAKARRALGATYTPREIVTAMLAWSARRSGAIPDRIVDPGAGSGRFLLAAAARFPEAALVGIEIDPVAALVLRANLSTRGLMRRATVLVGDYRATPVPSIAGRTLFIGNPPYLRHHGIAPEWKDWYAATARRFGVQASRLAGLHLHFFLRTLELAKAGDLGCFVTAAEWLDVNYGSALRQLLATRLGVTALHRLDPKALPFADAVTTGVITGFEIGAAPEPVRIDHVSSVAALADLSGGADVPRATLAAAPRWTLIARPAKAVPPGWVELGEICRVHRGQVTGGNAVWIAGPHGADLPPQFLFPAITKARELLAGEVLRDPKHLRRVIDLPRDLDEVPVRDAVDRFLAWARAQGADRSYIARHRKAWWSVDLKAPAPILCTYMARRPPAFVRNLCGARHINIAHGLYPRAPLDDAVLDALAAFLRENVAQTAGRTYAGGLTKFEPKELERIAVPRLEELAAGCVESRITSSPLSVQIRVRLPGTLF
ncbi:Eco57I restriction-modification methylase domain-containing protein [Dongia sedimenti]|uniref:site-specific DNA-methyltransferase (adenine-specific) n=1 Tax=Dongia sedimenti TaxID=3064282 RepID=A0ABU0YL62_9PROT|nr:N-6 DNA methylase [Rhodospirillaceae bacterium R-7]